MKWQDVKKQLPEKNGFYNVVLDTDEGRVNHSCWFEDGKWRYDNDLSSGEPLYSHAFYSEVIMWSEIPDYKEQSVEKETVGIPFCKLRVPDKPEAEIKYFKEVSSYLPYEVSFEHPIQIYTGNPPEPSHDEMGESILSTKNIIPMLKGGRLILRPLEQALPKKEYDFYSKVEHLGVKIKSPASDYWAFYHRMTNPNLSERFNVLELEHWFVELLKEHKFDVYGLIDKGVAVELKED